MTTVLLSTVKFKWSLKLKIWLKLKMSITCSSNNIVTWKCLAELQIYSGTYLKIFMSLECCFRKFFVFENIVTCRLTKFQTYSIIGLLELCEIIDLINQMIDWMINYNLLMYLYSFIDYHSDWLIGTGDHCTEAGSQFWSAYQSPTSFISTSSMVFGPTSGLLTQTISLLPKLIKIFSQIWLLEWWQVCALIKLFHVGNLFSVI